MTHSVNSISVFLVTFYPIVPTLTFLTVYWVKGSEDVAETERNGTTQEEETKKSSPDSKNYIILSHWAKMAPIIEGSIEAPIQFLFQVTISLY